MVERDLAKVEVAGSSPVIRSTRVIGKCHGDMVKIWRHSQAVRQRSATPSPPVRIWVAPPKYASVAQLVEQGTENPRVVGSIPTGGTRPTRSAANTGAEFVRTKMPEYPPFVRGTQGCKERVPALRKGWRQKQLNNSAISHADLAHLVERDLAKVEVAGSSPVIRSNGGLAQLGEHLPYKQRVTGSSPVPPTNYRDNEKEFSFFFFFYCGCC